MPRDAVTIARALKKYSNASNQTAHIVAIAHKPRLGINRPRLFAAHGRARYLINLLIVLTFSRQRRRRHFVISKIQLTNYLLDGFQFHPSRSSCARARARVIFALTGSARRAARGPYDFPVINRRDGFVPRRWRKFGFVN